MTWVATAIVGGALISTVGTAIASGNASSAAGRAADVQATAANNAANIQAGMYNQTRNDLLPFQNVGRSAIGTINGLIPGGLSTNNPALPGQGGTSPTGGGQGQLAGVDENGQPVYMNGGSPTGGSATPSGPQTFNGATGATGPSPTQPPGGPVPGSGTGLDQRFSIAGVEGGPGGQSISDPGSVQPGGSGSPFLNAQLSNIPQLGPAAQNSLGSLIPGSGTNPLQSSLYSYINGSSYTPNPLLSASNNAILGGSGSPNSALNNLMSFGDPSKNASLGKLNSLLGLDSSDPAARQKALEATPGYAFTLDQGLKSTQNSYAAQGLGSSGAAMKGAAQFATGLADQTYQSQLNNYLNNYNSQFNNAYNTYNTTSTNALNAFGQQSNLGLNAYNSSFTNALNLTGQQFNNANTGYQGQVNNAYNLLGLGANAASQTGTTGVQTASNAGGYLTSGAAATAGGIVGSANALNNGITGAANNIGGLGTLYGLNPSLFSGGGSGGNALGAGAPATGASYGGIYGRPPTSLNT